MSMIFPKEDDSTIKKPAMENQKHHDDAKWDAAVVKDHPSNILLGHSAAQGKSASETGKNADQVTVEVPADHEVPEPATDVSKKSDEIKRLELLEKMLYWKRFRLPRKNRLSASEQKYLLFDTDCGGFNNIRIAFELFLILAWITDRTFVLPPPQPWYLLDYGPQTRMKGSAGQKGTDYAEFFDIPHLWQALPTITTVEFIAKEGANLNIPEKFRTENWNSKLKNEWKQWKWTNWRNVSPGWNPYTHVIVWPLISDNPEPDAKRRSRRKLVEYSGELAASPVVNMASCKGDDRRFLGQVANWILYSPNHQELRIQQYQLIKYHIHFKKEIFDIASRVVNFLGMFKYSSLHIRRNELQYKNSFSSAEVSYQHVSPLLKKGEVLYISTDEVKEGFFNAFSEKHETFLWKDFFTERGGNVLTGIDIPRQWEGCIEQVICSCGRVFFGTKASTFSSYIYRLHAYMGAVDDNIYIHNKQYQGKPSHDTQQPYGYTAVEYMVEFPYLWRILPEVSKLEVKKS